MSSSSRAFGVLLGLRIQPEVSLSPRRMSIATFVLLLHSHAYVHFISTKTTFASALAGAKRSHFVEK